jgi:hypothetical protein
MPGQGAEATDFSCGQELDPGNLPPHFCKYQRDALGDWQLISSIVPAGYHCPPPPPSLDPSDAEAAAAPVLLYLYPCPP